MYEINLISVMWTQVQRLPSNEIMLVSFWYELGLNSTLTIRMITWSHTTPSEVYNNLSIDF